MTTQEHSQLVRSYRRARSLVDTLDRSTPEAERRVSWSMLNAASRALAAFHTANFGGDLSPVLELADEQAAAAGRLVEPAEHAA